MSNIKYCDNCNFLVHDSAKGDLCLACEKEQSPPAPERISEGEIAARMELVCVTGRGIHIARLKQIIEQLQRDLEELKADTLYQIENAIANLDKGLIETPIGILRRLKHKLGAK